MTDAIRLCDALTDQELDREIARAYQGMHLRNRAIRQQWTDRYERLMDEKVARQYPQPELPFDDDTEPASYYEAIGLDEYDVVGNR